MPQEPACRCHEARSQPRAANPGQLSRKSNYRIESKVASQDTYCAARLWAFVRAEKGSSTEIEARLLVMPTLSFALVSFFPTCSSLLFPPAFRYLSLKVRLFVPFQRFHQTVAHRCARSSPFIKPSHRLLIVSPLSSCLVTRTEYRCRR